MSSRLVSLPFMAAFQGHPNISPAEFAVLHQQHQQQQAMLYQAQQDFEKQQREGGGGAGLPPQDQAAMMQAMAQQQQQQHALQQQGEVLAGDAEFERERKEKRKVANREAARRMRQRRTEQLGSLSTTCDGLKHENNTLQQQCNMLIIQNRDLQTENAQLKEELLAIKHAVEAGRGQDSHTTEQRPG